MALSEAQYLRNVRAAKKKHQQSKYPVPLTTRLSRGQYLRISMLAEQQEVLVSDMVRELINRGTADMTRELEERERGAM